MPFSPSVDSVGQGNRRQSDGATGRIINVFRRRANSPIRQVILLSLFLSIPSWAAETQFLPPSHEVFRPLVADPRELQFAVRAQIPVSHKLLGEAAMGDYLGLFRLSGDVGTFQVSAGGGVFARFDLASTSNDMQTADFYANLPFDFQRGKWSARFMIYHTSSHLGDDYLKTTGLTTNKHSWDNLRWIVSYDADSWLRLYGGYTYAFRTLPQGLGRSALQGGVELRSAWQMRDHLQWYWANDFQSWERIQWNPSFHSQAGVKVAQSPKDGRALSLFLEYSDGGQPQGQFFQNKETLWSLGLKFDLF